MVKGILIYHFGARAGDGSPTTGGGCAFDLSLVACIARLFGDAAWSTWRALWTELDHDYHVCLGQDWVVWVILMGSRKASHFTYIQHSHN